PNLTSRLQLALAGRGTYNQDTVYRLMAQLGTDSLPANRNKLNLNYANANANTGVIDPSLTTRFDAWTPLGFFTNAADLMLRSQSSVVLSSLGVSATSYPLSLTNIPVYPTNLYAASVHRLLQLAA